jgi:hypothetical protein
MGDIFIGELCILNFELGYENLASAGVKYPCFDTVA